MTAFEVVLGKTDKDIAQETDANRQINQSPDIFRQELAQIRQDLDHHHRIEGQITDTVEF